MIIEARQTSKCMSQLNERAHAVNNDTVESLEPLRETSEKASSYREFELSWVRLY